MSAPIASCRRRSGDGLRPASRRLRAASERPPGYLLTETSSARHARCCNGPARTPHNWGDRGGTRVRFASTCPAPDVRNPLRSRPAWGSPTPRATFDNDAPAHGKLIRWLTKSTRPLRGRLEVTGVYSLDLSLALHRTKRVEVMVAKPRAVADFARADVKPRARSASPIGRHAAADPTCAGRCDTATRSGRARGRVRLGSTLRARASERRARAAGRPRDVVGRDDARARALGRGAVAGRLIWSRRRLDPRDSAERPHADRWPKLQPRRAPKLARGSHPFSRGRGPWDT